MGNADLARRILKFSVRSRCVWLYNLDAFPLGKRPWYPLSRRLYEPHSWCGHFGETSTVHAGNRTTLPLSEGLLTWSLRCLRYSHCLKSKGNCFNYINTANQGELMRDEARWFKLQRWWPVHGISPSYISFFHPPCNHSFFFFLWRCGPTQAMTSSFLSFLDHTQRRVTVGMTPLDAWSARRRDLSLTTHNTHNRQTSMTPVGFESTISAGERLWTHALDRATTGTGLFIPYFLKFSTFLFLVMSYPNFSQLFLIFLIFYV